MSLVGRPQRRRGAFGVHHAGAGKRVGTDGTGFAVERSVEF
jgi:hypothetical protein